MCLCVPSENNYVESQSSAQIHTCVTNYTCRYVNLTEDIINELQRMRNVSTNSEGSESNDSSGHTSRSNQEQTVVRMKYLDSLTDCRFQNDHLLFSSPHSACVAQVTIESSEASRAAAAEQLREQEEDEEEEEDDRVRVEPEGSESREKVNITVKLDPLSARPTDRRCRSVKILVEVKLIIRNPQDTKSKIVSSKFQR